VCERRLEVIPLNLIAHCIPYFLNPACPKIELRDDSERVDLNDFFRNTFQQQAKAREVAVDGHRFKLTGFRLWHNRAESTHRLIYAANYRKVKSETLTKYLPRKGLHLEALDAPKIEFKPVRHNLGGRTAAEHIQHSPSLYRPDPIRCIRSNPS
jgi:hypothetical protein